MLEKLNLTVKIESSPDQPQDWQVASFEHPPVYRIVFQGPHAEDLATEYASAKFTRVQVHLRPSI